MVPLVQQMLSGDRLALSRLISRVEARSKDLVSIMSQVQERCGKAAKIGVTGPPGAGKSTLVDRIVAHLRKSDPPKTVGVIAIDPSSPFSGGAVLGDRIRMKEHSGDEGVFIRNLGTRGSHGGISRATHEVIKLYDAFGMDTVVVETVGVGQTELDIMEIVDTTIVILTPESGDTIQTMKAGILEIANIFVVNKADRDGADQMEAELKGMLDLGGTASGWRPPVLKTEAVKDVGIKELLTEIENHRTYLKKKGLQGKKRVALQEAKEIILEGIKSHLDDIFSGTREIENPYRFAQEYLKRIEKSLWPKLKASTPRRAKSSKK